VYVYVIKSNESYDCGLPKGQLNNKTKTKLYYKNLTIVVIPK